MKLAAIAPSIAQVGFRQLDRADLNDVYLGWLNDPEVTRYMESGTFPATMEDLNKFYNEVTSSQTQVVFAMTDKQSGRHIGNVKLGPIHWVHRRAAFGIMIGDKSFWGKGVGTRGTQMAVEYGFCKLNLQRIDLTVFADHESAIRVYEKIGFKVEGRLRAYAFKDGAYKDMLYMGLLNAEYLPPSRSQR